MRIGAGSAVCKSGKTAREVRAAFRYWEKEKSYGEAPRGTRLASQFKYTLF